MNEEIKEILDFLGNDKNYNRDCNDGSYYLELPYREAHELKDCITNLQEENKKFKNWINALNKDNHNYKSRNEKAIEFIKEKINSTKGVINDYMYHKEHNKHLIELLNEDVEMYKKELNILNGGDEE